MWTNRVIIGAVLALAALVAFAGISEAVARGPRARAQQIERGEFLSIIGGCNDCHSPGVLYGAMVPERQLSGSELGWAGPWGVSFPRNLTPDVETGIGSWSEDDIVNAIRTGIRPNGTALLPPMPWPNYAHLSDADAHALAAYLKSVKPVRHRAPDPVPPGVDYAGPALRFPAPPLWDTPPSSEGTPGSN